MDMVHPTYKDKNNRLAKYNFEDLDAVILGRKVSLDDKKVIKIIQTHCKNNGQKLSNFMICIIQLCRNNSKLSLVMITSFHSSNKNHVTFINCVLFDAYVAKCY